jgi:hypothetical protein
MRPAARVRRAWVVLAAAVEQGRSRALWCPCRSWFCSRPVRRSACAAPSLRPRVAGRARTMSGRAGARRARRDARGARRVRGASSFLCLCLRSVCRVCFSVWLCCPVAQAARDTDRTAARSASRVAAHAALALHARRRSRHSSRPPFYPVRASTRAIARATTTHAAAPTPLACVMTTRARIPSRNPRRMKRTSRRDKSAVWEVRGAIRTWRFGVIFARRRRRRSAYLLFFLKNKKKVTFYQKMLSSAMFSRSGNCFLPFPHRSR